MYGNLGRVLETSSGPMLVSRDFDTRQLEYIKAENAFVPRYLRGTELKKEDIDGFRRGEVRHIAIVQRDGSVNIVPYQYNAIFRKPMELLTLEQRNALADQLRQQRDLERIISQPEEATQRMQYPQTPKQTAEQNSETVGQGQTPAPEQNQQGQTIEAAGQEQAPAVRQSQQEQARETFGQGQSPSPEPSNQTQAAEAAGHEQAPAAGLSQQGQAAETAGQGQAPAHQQNQQGQATAQGQTSQQGQRQPGAAQKPPRPQVSLPANKSGRRKGKHL